MAEFVEIVNQARRICDYYSKDEDCDSCPLSFEKTGRDDGLCLTITSIDSQDAIEIERIVMEWVKEHPEPTYPSWEDGWKSLFPDADCPCPNDCFGEECPTGMGCSGCVKRPMSKYVAEKLGIKPITEVIDDCTGCRWIDKNIDEEPCKNCCVVMGGSAPVLWEKGYYG